MHYKVVDLISDIQEVTVGTCNLCFSIEEVEEGYIVLEDENGSTIDIPLTTWEWGRYTTIQIDNIVDFSHWLIKQDYEMITKETNKTQWLFERFEEYSYS